MASIGFDQGEGAERGRWRPTRRVVAAGVAAFVLAGAAVAVNDAGLLPPSDELAQSSSGGGVAAGMADVDTGEAATAVPGSNLTIGMPQGAAARSALAPEVAPPPGVPGAEARIVKHAELAIEVDGSVTQAFDRVTEVARSQGGFVVTSSTSSVDDGPGRADLTLRVPAERFDAARSALIEVGEVRSVQVSGDDVTAQLVDLEARLRALRAEEEALNGLLSRATDVGEVLAVRQQVSANRLEIEQLAAQQASLDDRASFSTLRVTLSQPGAATFPSEPGPATGLAGSFERAVAAAVAVLGGMVVVLGYVAPFLVLGLLALAGQRLARLRRRPA